MASATVKTEGAWVQGRNGLVDLREIQVWQSMGGGNVFIDGVSLKRGVTVNGGFGGIRESEMDALCKDWLTARGYMVSEPGAQTVNQELLDAGKEFERIIDDLAEYSPEGYSSRVNDALGRWATARARAGAIEAQTSAP